MVRVPDHQPTSVRDAGSIPGSVKFLTSRHQLATGAALHCGLCLGQWCGNGLRQLVTLERVVSDYNEKLILFFKKNLFTTETIEVLRTGIRICSTGKFSGWYKNYSLLLQCCLFYITSWHPSYNWIFHLIFLLKFFILIVSRVDLPLGEKNPNSVCWRHSSSKGKFYLYINDLKPLTTSTSPNDNEIYVLS